MIISVQLRYIKTYSGINYIPLSDGDQFCGVIGDNGIGKSSILEALDCFFNNREWNLNISIRRSGLSTTNPSIIPLFLMKKSQVDDDVVGLAVQLSDVVWGISEEDILPRNRRHFQHFNNQREVLKKKFDKEEYLLLPLGVDYEDETTFGIFDTKKIFSRIFPEKSIEAVLQLNDFDETSSFDDLRYFVTEIYDYIFIPKDISPIEFTRLETSEIQNLMGESLNEILRRIIPRSQITEINTGLNEFLNELSGTLESYSFRTPTDRQQNLKVADVYSLVISAFFNIRRLHKSKSGQWLEIRQLSSGEQQRALIDVAHSLVKNYRSTTDNLIICIDEPEASLHMSACYDQFQRLIEISDHCSQLLFATHWYGFIPVTDKGNVSVISRGQGGHLFDQIDLYAHRENIKQQIRHSRGKLPHDVRLKGLNDFIQSVVTSILKDEPYNWLICEGSSEKVYFEFYFKEIIEQKKLKIIPVGGASEVKKIYQRLLIHFDEFNSSIKGKVYLLSDTDAQLVRYNSSNQYSNLECRRMVNIESSEITSLVNIESNPVSPETEIELALNGKAYIDTLLLFKSNYQEELDFINEGDAELISIDSISAYALDFTRSQLQGIDQFFNRDDNKMIFAKKYVSMVESGMYSVPDWIEKIRLFYN